MSFRPSDGPGGDGSAMTGGEASRETGPLVAHLVGVSPGLLEAARRFRESGVPIVYSPAPASVPGTLAGLAARLGLAASRAAAGHRMMREIAGMASILIAGSEGAARTIVKGVRLSAGAGASGGGRRPEGTVRLLPSPPWLRPDPPAGGRGNLVVGFCDRFDDGWNVLRFIQAMEKINADGAIVTAGEDGERAEECARKIGENPRLRVVHPEGGPGAGPGAPSDAAREAIAAAAVFVDPSTEGLAGSIAEAAAGAGAPAVISRRSVIAADRSTCLKTFEPSSWELLHHAITSALNLGSGEGDGGSRSGGAGSDRPGAEEYARRLAGIYREAAGG